MRTTVNLDERLFREVKAEAARQGRTLGAVISDALRDFLARSETEPNSPPALPVSSTPMTPRFRGLLVREIEEILEAEGDDPGRI